MSSRMAGSSCAVGTRMLLCGAIFMPMTVGAYTTSDEVAEAVEEVCLEECAQLSLNLTGGVYVNQTA